MIAVASLQFTADRWKGARLSETSGSITRHSIPVLLVVVSASNLVRVNIFSAPLVPNCSTSGRAQVIMICTGLLFETLVFLGNSFEPFEEK